MSKASSVNLGAITTSKNIACNVSAKSEVTVLFNAIMPPKIDWLSAS